MVDVFYFLVFPQGDKNRITVVDLSYACSYERDEWINVNSDTFNYRDEEIPEARRIALKYDLKYELFESRYYSETDETNELR